MRPAAALSLPLPLALALLVTACGASHSNAQDLVLRNVTVIDGTGAPPVAERSIIIRGGVIAAIQPAADSLPRDLPVRDMRGRFVIPGLIDAHVHLGTRERPPGLMEGVLRAAFMGGVTTVRDMGGSHAIVHPLARRSADDTIPIPRIVVAAIMSGAGDWIEGERGRFYAGSAPLGESPSVRRVHSIQDVAPAIAAAKAAGAHGIKIYNSIAPELVHALADEARRQGLLVWSHLWVDPGTPMDVLTARPLSVSHADMFVAQLMTPATRAGNRDAYRAERHRLYLDSTTLRTSAFRDLVAEMRRHQIALDATLFIMRPEPDSAGRWDERGLALFRNAVAFARHLHREGVPVGAGTDHIGGSTPTLHLELQLLVDSVGMTPLEAIRAATLVNARSLGIADRIGTVEPGKLADLVILDANPASDIANTIRIHASLKAGRVFVRERPMPVPPGARAPRG